MGATASAAATRLAGVTTDSRAWVAVGMRSSVTSIAATRVFSQAAAGAVLAVAHAEAGLAADSAEAAVAGAGASGSAAACVTVPHRSRVKALVPRSPEALVPAP